VGKLSPEQRRQLGAERRKAARERMARFFKLPKEEQLAELDKQIQRMEESRKAWEARQAERAARGEESNGAGGPGGNAAGAGGPGGPGGWRRLGPEEREQRRKQFLDSTTPEERAQFSLYRQMLNQRRQELGLPAFGPGGRR
jgi:hypothetical protein